MKELFVHLGTHKTGTKSLQEFFHVNQDALSDFGLYNPRSGKPDGLTGHHNIAWELSKNKSFSKDFGTIQDLFNEIQNVYHEKVIISSEGFQHSLTRGLTDFVEKAKYYNFKVIPILFIRDQLSYAKSLYVTLRLYNNKLTFKEFLRDILDKKSIVHNNVFFSFDYRKLIADIKQLHIHECFIHGFSKQDQAKIFNQILKIIFPSNYKNIQKNLIFPEKLNQLKKVQSYTDVVDSEIVLNFWEKKGLQCKFFKKFFFDNLWLYSKYRIKLNAFID